MTKVGHFKHHIQKYHGKAVVDQVWLVKDRSQPLHKDEGACDCISDGSEVQVLLVEQHVNERVKILVPRLLASDPVELINSTLHGKKLQDVDADQLAEAMKVNTEILKLNLKDNGIGDARSVALARAFKITISVTDVRLGKTTYHGK